MRTPGIRRRSLLQNGRYSGRLKSVESCITAGIPSGATNLELPGLRIGGDLSLRRDSKSDDSGCPGRPWHPVNWSESAVYYVPVIFSATKNLKR